MSGDLLKEVTIPIFSGFIGYATNWTGVWMLFNPLEFKGFRVPGLRSLAHVLPRRIQQIPGVMQGGAGWQGIIPSRAAKMGSIAVDKGIAKVGSPADFYEQLEPQRIAEQILVTSRGDMRDLVDRIMEREHPQLWNELPARVREAVHERVQADVDYDEPAHPAFERILEELAPDEARILRLLFTTGAQPSVDVREAKPLGIASGPIEGGLTMIGTEAGCRFLDRVPSYLNNLYRLGLIWFTREPLEDPLRYQVLEAQPEVLTALGRARSKTVRRSIRLTSFGEDFCEVCLPMHTAEIDALDPELGGEPLG